MKKLILILILFSSVCFGQNLSKTEGLVYNGTTLYNGEYVEYYASGEQKISANFKDGLLDGLLISYFENGNIKESYNYKQGKFNGEVKSWDQNGVLTGIAVYNEGIKDGVWKIFMNGNLQYEITYLNGKRIDAIRAQNF